MLEGPSGFGMHQEAPLQVVDTSATVSMIKHFVRKHRVRLQRGWRGGGKGKKEKKTGKKKRLDEVAGTAGGNLKSVYIRAGCS